MTGSRKVPRGLIAAAVGTTLLLGLVATAFATHTRDGRVAASAPGASTRAASAYTSYVNVPPSPRYDPGRPNYRPAPVDPPAPAQPFPTPELLPTPESARTGAQKDRTAARWPESATVSAAPATSSPVAVPTPTRAPAPTDVRPIADPVQPAAPCPAVALFVVPATGETTADAAPTDPKGLLAGVTSPLTERWSPEELHVEFVPYPASLDRPVLYPISETRGVAALEAAMSSQATRCPGTSLNGIGYSQGADVLSDLLHRIARGQSTIAPEQVGSTVMLGSPRRDPAVPNVVAAPGRGVLGPRPTAELGALRDRTFEVCVAEDPICATESLSIADFREGLASGAHQSYANTPVGPEAVPLFTVLNQAYDNLISATLGASAPTSEQARVSTAPPGAE